MKKFDAWHTDEAYNCFANDEYLYTKAMKMRIPLFLKQLWKVYRPTKEVHITKVDWAEVLRCLKDQ